MQKGEIVRKYTVIAGGLILLAVLATIPFVGSQPLDPIPRIKEATFETLEPYLEARVVIKGPELGVCWKNDEDLNLVPITNFEKLSERGIPRDGAFEAIALSATQAFVDDGRSVSRILGLPPQDWSTAYGEGESPWGLFGDPRIRAALEPYIVKAKEELIAKISTTPEKSAEQDNALEAIAAN